MRRSIAAFTIFAALILSTAGSAGAQKQTLAPKYKKWLTEEAVYIITTIERQVFEKLTTDEDRDRFMEAFWEQRDPTPGTPRNEFREEHYRRIEFANKTFGRGTPFQGWRTERGRIYIILGPPVDLERAISSNVYPLEIWFYRGNPALGQAAFFRLLFYKKWGAGDYVLYNPTADSPKDVASSVRIGRKSGGLPADWDETDVGAYFALKEVSGEAANSLLSAIPGNNQDLRIQSSILLAEVQKYPQKRVKDDYALAILEHRPTVVVSYSERFIGNRSAIGVFEDPSGLSFIHYVLVPDSISIDSYDEKYFADLRMTVRLSDAKGKTLYQQDKSIPIELRREELKSIRDSSFQLYDAVPVIPGTWKLNLLLENTVSKEFTTVEQTISVPAPGEARMSPLVLARKVFRSTPSGGPSRAYQFGSLQIYPSVNNVFQAKDRVFAFFQLSGTSPILQDRGVLDYSLLRDGQAVWTSRKPIKSYNDLRNVLEELPLDKLNAGSYSVRVGLRNEAGMEIAAAQTDFRVRAETSPGLWVVAQTNPPAGDPSYGYILGTQYLNRGDIDTGLKFLARAHQGKPDSVEYAVGMARALLLKKDAFQAMEVLTPLAESKEAKFDFFYTLGQAVRDSGDIKSAVKWFGKALTFRGPVVEALNALGECYLKLGDKEQALQSFKKSLEISPNQARIKDLVKDIR